MCISALIIAIQDARNMQIPRQVGSLKFHLSSFDEIGLTNISSLKGLRCLEMNMPRHHKTSIKFFQYLKPSLPLQEITFHFTMRLYEEEKGYVKHLNAIKSLKKIVVYCPGEMMDAISENLSPGLVLEQYQQAPFSFSVDIGIEYIFTFVLE